MSKSRWIIAAALGLVLATSGQAQEQTDGTGGQADQEQSPTTPDIPTPFPVEIVEDDATADARQRSEEEARQREIADLAAQEGMNAATQSIEQATRDMRDYTLYSTVAVWIGTFLLILTLWLTRQANRSAQRAVKVTQDIGEAQTRAYITIGTDGEHQPGLKVFIKEDRIVFRFSFFNRGQTPASGLVFVGATWIKGFGEVCGWGSVFDRHGAMAPNDIAFIDAEIKIKSRKWLYEQGSVRLFLKGAMHYKTCYGDPAITSIAIFADIDSGRLGRSFGYCTDGNSIK